MFCQPHYVPSEGQFGLLVKTGPVLHCENCSQPSGHRKICKRKGTVSEIVLAHPRTKIRQVPPPPRQQ